jgi:hypothetical protein
MLFHLPDTLFFQVCNMTDSFSHFLFIYPKI